MKVKNSNGIIFDITPDKEMRFNPSPSNDPWFNDPRNMAELNRAIERHESGEATYITWDDLKVKLGL